MADRVIHDFVCTACGCTCDDLAVTVRDQQITAFEPPCPLAAQFLLAERPAAPTDDESAKVQQAAGLLRAARAPLIMGIERASVEAQRLAVAIADRLGAYLVPTDDRGVSRSHVAAQTLGAVTATLGEVAQRSDLIVYWQCDPATTHPRHIERFASRAGQRRIVVDSWPSPSAALADEYVLIPADSGVACLATLRAVVRGVALGANAVEEQTGNLLATWQSLAEQLCAAKYAAVFYVAANAADESTTQAIQLLARDLHRHARAIAPPLGAAWNAVGAAQVLAWQTGFPGAVSFARGYPQELPGTGSAAALLSRREVDVALVVAADPLAHLPAAAAAHLQSIPTIVLDDHDTATTAAATIAIRTSSFGIESTGTTFRSDGVALPLRPALVPTTPDLAAVLDALAAAIGARTPDSES
jgi:formylmethanofuran dehydrogenase subunit B